MQADNLTERDTQELEKFYKDQIKPRNPDATLITFLTEKFKQKDCLFKDKCKEYKGGEKET